MLSEFCILEIIKKIQKKFMKQNLTFGEAEYHTGRTLLQRVYYKGVEVGALIGYKSGALREYFISCNLRRKTIDSIKGERDCLANNLRVDESEDNGFYEIVYTLNERQKYCDLISLARRIYKRIRPIYCKHCGALLFYTDSESDAGAGAIEAPRYGYVYKMPFLYNPEIHSAFFCNKRCCNEWFAKNTSEEDKQKAQEIIDDLKQKMPKIINGATQGAKTLYAMLMEMKMSKDGAKKFAKILKDEQAKQEFIQDFIKRNKQS